jgi:hypothetical protein
MFCWSAAIFFSFFIHSLLLIISAILRWGKTAEENSSNLLRTINTLTLSVAPIAYYLYGMFILVAIYIVSMQEKRKNKKNPQISIDLNNEKD